MSRNRSSDIQKLFNIQNRIAELNINLANLKVVIYRKEEEAKIEREIGILKQEEMRLKGSLGQY